MLGDYQACQVGKRADGRGKRERCGAGLATGGGPRTSAAHSGTRRHPRCCYRLGASASRVAGHIWRRWVRGSGAVLRTKWLPDHEHTAERLRVGERFVRPLLPQSGLAPGARTHRDGATRARGRGAPQPTFRPRFSTFRGRKRADLYRRHPQIAVAAAERAHPPVDARHRGAVLHCLAPVADLLCIAGRVGGFAR